MKQGVKLLSFGKYSPKLYHKQKGQYSSLATSCISIFFMLAVVGATINILAGIYHRNSIQCVESKKPFDKFNELKKANMSGEVGLLLLDTEIRIMRSMPEQNRPVCVDLRL